MAAPPDRHELVIATMEAIKRLVGERVERRLAAEPWAGRPRLIDEEVAAAAGRLRRLAAELERERDAEGAALVAALIEEWLPVLADELRPAH